MLLRRWNVTRKILATLAIPILALIVAAGVISVGAIKDQRIAAQTSELLQAMDSVDEVGAAITMERIATLNLVAVGGMSASSTAAQTAKTEMNAARETTDADIDSMVADFRNVDLSALDPDATALTAVESMLGSDSAIQEIRAAVDGGLGLSDLGTVIAGYDKVLQVGLGGMEALATTTTNQNLVPYLDAYISTDELLAQITLEQWVGGALLKEYQLTQAVSDESKVLAASVFSKGDLLADEATKKVAALGLPGVEINMAGDSYEELRRSFLAGAPDEIAAGTAARWSESVDGVRNRVIEEVRDPVHDATLAMAENDARDSRNSTIFTVGVTVLAVVLSILFAFLIARTITRPLRRLTRAAQEVRDELPGIVEQAALPGDHAVTAFSPLEVESSDEIGQLAAAFNDVNATTLSVARDQAALRGSIAEMFVNVARRDQVLLNRQLAFLDDLERTEENPTVLSNFFRLDHLATRMRRNAESLLVLAGIDSGRRARQPMALSDVIRTASSEIELYDRVRLNLAIDPLILGHNALNTAHLIAELLENATMFSEPHTPVEVSAAYDGQFVRVAVRDHGLGMSADEIEDAQRRIGSQSATDVVGAQRLGLYVVGRLADRLGARIAFVSGRDGNGTEAIADLPISLFAADSGATLAPAIEQFDQAAPPAEMIPEPAIPEPLMSEFAGPAPTVEEPEAPLATPVDLNALTDGTTSADLPKRRVRPAEPAASAPSATLSQSPPTGSIVLPPLVTPDIPIDLPQGEDTWSPPEDITTPNPSALPSRRPKVAVEIPDPPLGEGETPVLDVDTRTGLFSSFRTMGDLDTSTVPPANPMELAPEPETTATDINFSTPGEAPEEEWTPTFALQDAASLSPRTGDDGPTDVGSTPSAPGGEPFVPSASFPGGSIDPVTPAGGLPQRGAPTEDASYRPTPAPEPLGTPATPANDWLSALTDETVMLNPRPSEVVDASRPEQPAPAPADEPFAVESADVPVPGEGVDVPALPVPMVDSRLAETAEPGFASPEPTSVVPAVAPEPAPIGEAQVPGFVRHEAEAFPEEVGAPAPAVDGSDPEGLMQALPRFEELLTDLPTRRSARETARPKTGLFARRSRPPATGQVESVAYPVPERSFPVVPPTYGAETTVPPSGQFAPPVASEPYETPAMDAAAPVPTTEPSVPGLFSQEPVSTDRYAPEHVTEPSVEPLASEAWRAPVFDPQPALAPANRTFTNQVPVVSPADLGHEDAETGALPVLGGAADGAWDSLSASTAPRGTEAVEDTPLFGPPAPLTKRLVRERSESDSWYGDDSVEARSEWTASAVLYEEMSSLLRTSGDSDLVAPASDTYQPVRMESDGQHLSRRPMEHREGYVDRFTARIDRDPEQLRARLAAFQSATARGRAEAQEEVEAGWAPGSVPEQAPQPR